MFEKMIEKINANDNGKKLNTLKKIINFPVTFKKHFLLY